MNDARGEHTQKMNDSISVLEKLVAANNPNVTKAVVALAKVNIRICRAMVWAMWYKTEDKPKEKDPYDMFMDATRGRR